MAFIFRRKNFSQSYMESLSDISEHLNWCSSHHFYHKVTHMPSGGSKGGARDVCPPSGPKFLHFHAVFGKNWPNNRLAPPLWAWRPLFWEIMDPPLYASHTSTKNFYHTKLKSDMGVSGLTPLSGIWGFFYPRQKDHCRLSKLRKEKQSIVFTEERFLLLSVCVCEVHVIWAQSRQLILLLRVPPESSKFLRIMQELSQKRRRCYSQHIHLS